MVNPARNNLWEFWKEYCQVLSDYPDMRWGQYFLNIVYPTVNDPVLFYEPDVDKCTYRIMSLYCKDVMSGELIPVNEEMES